MIDILIAYHEALGKGIVVTLKICAYVWGIGIVYGVIFAFIGHKYIYVRKIFSVFSFILGGIPVLILLFWFHYPFQSLMGVVIDPFYTTIFCLGLVNIFIVFSLISKELMQIDKEYGQIAKVFGNSIYKIFFHIELPLVFKRNISPILLAQVNMMHMSLFGSIISVNEILRVAHQINSISYQTIEIYTIVGVIFLLISLPLNGIALLLNKRYNYVSR
ncbi:MAG: ABC transporter permease subunit [Candidatus Gracilibacteria bacterium]|nr:ABC transporter permease subunit [Candidatus Gracilibacteria bacterium]